MVSNGLDKLSKEELLQHVNQLEEEFDLFSNEAKHMEELMDEELCQVKSQLEEVKGKLDFQTQEYRKVTDTLISTKKDLKTAKDQLVQTSLKSIERSRSNSVSPRKRSRLPLQPININVNDNLISPTKSKLTILETENDTLESSIRILKNEIKLYKDKYDICLERIAHLEHEMKLKLQLELTWKEKEIGYQNEIDDLKSQLKLALQHKEQISLQEQESLKHQLLKEFTDELEERQRKFDLNQHHWGQEREMLKQNQHSLQERLDLWAASMDEIMKHNSDLERKCAKLEKIARLVKLKERGGPLSAFQTPALV